MDNLYFQPEIETMERSSLETLQLKRLKESIGTALRSPFYSTRLGKLGITPDSIRTLGDLRRLPFTTKEDLRSNYPFGLVAVPADRVVRLHSSSGTTGNPTVICHSQHDLECWAGRVARCLYMVGLRNTDVFQNTSGYGMFTGGLGFQYGAELLGALTVPAAAGNARLLAESGLPQPSVKAAGTVIYIIFAGRYAGYLVVADEVREDAAAAIRQLKELGVRQTVMLTGDRPAVAESVARSLGVDEFHAGLLPADKVIWLEKLLAAKSAVGKLMFVGDGINDAPVLARADIGVAMGGIGSDAAIEAADVVIMTDEPSRLASAIRISRKTLRIANENIVFAIGVKLLVLGLGAAGMASIWAAVFADVGVSVIAILNAVRALRLHKYC